MRASGGRVIALCRRCAVTTENHANMYVGCTDAGIVTDSVARDFFGGGVDTVHGGYDDDIVFVVVAANDSNPEIFRRAA